MRCGADRRAIESHTTPGPTARLLAYLASAALPADDDAFPDILDSPPRPMAAEAWNDHPGGSMGDGIAPCRR